MSEPIVITLLYDATGKFRGRSTIVPEEYGDYDQRWDAADYANMRQWWRKRGHYPVPAVRS